MKWQGNNALVCRLAVLTMLGPMTCSAALAAESKPGSKHEAAPQNALHLNNLSHSTGNGLDHTKAEPLDKPKKTEWMTVNQVIATYGPEARAAWKIRISEIDKKMTYPPASSVWICLKEERQLLIFVRDSHGKFRCLKNYPIIGASGRAGPKLKEGDKQVPEGFYKIVGFRPNVIAHLGLAVDYPNAEDRAHAKDEGRKNLGGDILIHGSRWSTGCLAMGNQPIEELFTLAYDMGCSNIELIFAPCNLLKKSPDQESTATKSEGDKNSTLSEAKLRTIFSTVQQKSTSPNKSLLTWVTPLYGRLRSRLQEFSTELPQ
ncbi:MAG: hypothetical protein K2X77_00600 [Candidatus Obscuribacterales bacterium]|jgi:hypothetical protein|nr:hypothetical protein [Candidatus Obscuribacterales bacterium]